MNFNYMLNLEYGFPMSLNLFYLVLFSRLNFMDLKINGCTIARSLVSTASDANFQSSRSRQRHLGDLAAVTIPEVDALSRFGLKILNSRSRKLESR